MLRLLFLLPFLFELSYSETILVDGVSAWPNPTVHVGDSVIFKDKNEDYKLYIFKNQRAFNVCNFTQASLLTNSFSNSFKWYPSRPGFYYFTFSKASLKSCKDKLSQKLSIKVTLPPLVAPPILAPISGGEVSSSPAYPWPFPPRESAYSPAPTPSNGGARSPMAMPAVVPGDKGGSMPFINSNPAVPLPTDEVDSATIRPLSVSAHHQQVAVGKFGAHTITLFSVILLFLM
ncbi:Cupredoxin superfamily protein [Euphorbia peplus]|nr:Cupredoxin superfamily protein [Euphorbia peplus]